MNQKIYELIKAERFETGVINHHVRMSGEEKDFRYQAVRIGLVWDSLENPAFFVVGGMETEDKFAASLHGTVSIIQEFEVQNLSLDVLFDALSDSYVSMLCDAVYVDCGEEKEGYKSRLWDYLDKRNLRAVNIYDIPYRDIALRFSTIKDFNDSGCLIIDRGSPLFQDLQGISRSHLKDRPETQFYRLNALGYLLSGFEKYKPIRPFKMPREFRGSRNGSWML